MWNVPTGSCVIHWVPGTGPCGPFTSRASMYCDLKACTVILLPAPLPPLCFRSLGKQRTPPPGLPPHRPSAHSTAPRGLGLQPEALNTEPFFIVPIRCLYWHKSDTAWQRESLSQVASMLRLPCSYPLSLIHREPEAHTTNKGYTWRNCFKTLFSFMCARAMEARRSPGAAV